MLNLADGIASKPEPGGLMGDYGKKWKANGVGREMKDWWA